MTSPGDPHPLSVRRWGRRFGPRIALETASEKLSYEELADRSAALRARVARSDRPCAIGAHRTLDAFIAVYACLDEGRPLLLFSPSAPKSQQKHLIDEVGATDVLSEGGWTQASSPTSVSPPHENDHVLIPTSGTTAKPKIVCLSRDALVTSALASNERLGLDEGGRWALTLPYAHVGGLSILLRCGLAGATVVVKDFDWDSPSGLSSLEKDSITHLSVVPTQLHRALRSDVTCPKSLRSVLVGGAASGPALRRAIRAADFPAAFTYGFTEAGSQVCTQELGRTPTEKPERDVGRPLGATEVALDGSGRISVRGPTLMNRYWGDPPRAPEDWFVTQDCGHWDENDRLVVSGRTDNVIISGGENVAAEHIEDALMDLPFVDDAAVFGLPDDKWGQVVVALLSGSKKDTAEVRDALRDHLAPFALPKETFFCDKLPRLATGKLDRRAAHSRLQELRAQRRLTAEKKVRH